MIAKIISYMSQFGGVSRAGTGSEKMLSLAWAVAKYVAHLELSDQDLKLLSQMGTLPGYTLDDKQDPHRILDSQMLNLQSPSADECAMEFAYLVAARGTSALRQLVVSYGEDEATPEDCREHRDIFLRVLRANNYPGVYAMHGDTQHAHFHLALCRHDTKSNELGPWGQQYEIEAVHIATAICEYRGTLQCEPNRRYVADKTGVYHTWSGVRVAGPDGTITKSGVFKKKIQPAQIDFDKAITPPPGTSNEGELPMPLAITLLAKGAINEAKSWEEFHRGLARCGISYELKSAGGKITGGYLVANIPNKRHESFVTGSECNAGYKRLLRKFKTQSYEAAPENLEVRLFRSPRYSAGKHDAEDRTIFSEQAIEKDVLRSIEELEAAIRERHKAARRDTAAEKRARAKLKSASAKRDNYNRLQQERAESERIEREHLAGLRRARKFDDNAKPKGRPSKADPVEGILTGNDDTPGQPAGKWRQAYLVEHERGRTVYRRNELIAFVETTNFVTVFGRDNQSTLDALLLAQERFGTVKITGTRRFQHEAIALAVKHGINLSKSHAASEAKHRRRLDAAAVLNRTGRSTQPDAQVKAKAQVKTETKSRAEQQAKRHRVQEIEKRALADLNRGRDGQLLPRHLRQSQLPKSPDTVFLTKEEMRILLLLRDAHGSLDDLVMEDDGSIQPHPDTHLAEEGHDFRDARPEDQRQLLAIYERQTVTRERIVKTLAEKADETTFTRGSAYIAQVIDDIDRDEIHRRLTGPLGVELIATAHRNYTEHSGQAAAGDPAPLAKSQAKIDKGRQRFPKGTTAQHRDGLTPE